MNKGTTFILCESVVCCWNKTCMFFSLDGCMTKGLITFTFEGGQQVIWGKFAVTVCWDKLLYARKLAQLGTHCGFVVSAEFYCVCSPIPTVSASVCFHHTIPWGIPGSAFREDKTHWGLPENVWEQKHVIWLFMKTQVTWQQPVMKCSYVKEKAQHFEKHTYLLPCQGLDKNIDTTLMFMRHI